MFMQMHSYICVAAAVNPARSCDSYLVEAVNNKCWILLSSALYTLVARFRTAYGPWVVVVTELWCVCVCVCDQRNASALVSAPRRRCLGKVMYLFYMFCLVLVPLLYNVVTHTHTHTLFLIPVPARYLILHTHTHTHIYTGVRRWRKTLVCRHTLDSAGAYTHTRTHRGENDLHVVSDDELHFLCLRFTTLADKVLLRCRSGKHVYITVDWQYQKAGHAHRSCLVTYIAWSNTWNPIW